MIQIYGLYYKEGGYILTKKVLAVSLALLMSLLNMGTFTNVEAREKEVLPVEENVQYTPPQEETPAEEASAEEVPAEAVEVTYEEQEVNKRVIDPTKPMVALTFDDGPSKYTAEILKVLKENNSVATFFVLGSEVNKYKDVLNQVIAEGNEIGNHSYNHKNLKTITDEELYKQVQGTDDLVYIASGYTPKVMRPPYGISDAELNKKINKPIVKWSIDTLDWKNRDTDKVVAAVLNDVKDGDIVLMHDLYDSTAQAAKIIIPKLVEQGYQLVTVSEMSEYRDVTLTQGQQYYSMYK